MLTLHTDDAVVLTLLQQADSVIAHCGSIHAVTQSGRATALDMAQNGSTGIDAGAGLDLVGNLLRVANALGNDDNEVALTGALRLGDFIQNVVLHIEFLFGQQHSHGTGGNGNVQSDVTRIAAHDLDHAAAVMALGGIAQLVDHFQGGVHCGIVADGVIGAGDIIIDGAGQTDHRNAAVCQLTGTAVGAVAADDHQRVNAQLTALCSALVLALLGLELQAAGRIQDGATGRDDIGNAAQVHFKALAVQQAIVAALNADHTEALVQACTDNGANCSIHTRSVAAAGQHTNRFDLLFHGKIPSNCFVIYLWSTYPLSLGTSSIALLRS